MIVKVAVGAKREIATVIIGEKLNFASPVMSEAVGQMRRLLLPLCPYLSFKGFLAKEGLSWVFFCTIALRKTRNPALL